VNTAMANITMVVPFSPGGAFDEAARKFGKYIEDTTGNVVKIENITGAGGLVGANRVLNSKEDTILFTSSGLYLSIIEHGITLNQFVIVSRILESPLFIATSSDRNMTCEDLRNKNQIFVGHAGGSSLIPVKVLQKQDKKYNDVGYRGVANALIDVLGGRLDFTLLGSYQDRPDIRLLANTSVKKYKKVISWKECLGISDNITTSYIVATKKDADVEFVKKLNSLAISFNNDANMKKWIDERGLIPTAENLVTTNKKAEYELDFFTKLFKD
jgi:tripartite-type tricarboxylate transporter receptor subunit TctC